MRTLLAMILAIAAATAVAEVTQVEGKLTALDAAKRTLTIDGKTYDIAKKCDVSIKGQPGKLEDIPKDESVVVSYDDKFEMVSAIAAGQSTWLFCDLQCNGKDPASDHRVVSPNEIVFPPNPTKGRALLVSGRKYEKCVVKFEFMYDSPEMPGNPFVNVAARAPNLKGKEFTERWPFGIEFKLWHGGFGRLVLPHPDFQADMAFGQERDGRSVPPLQQQTPLRNGWNIVEIAVQGDNNVVIKGNGVTLNAIGNAKNIEGHIVIFPPVCEFRLRNMTVEEGGTVTPLLFSSMSVMPCEAAKP